jgi:hypothetical protein
MASQDLTTLAQVREHQQQTDASNTSQDGVITDLITVASDMIMRYCQREFATTPTYTMLESSDALIRVTITLKGKIMKETGEGTTRKKAEQMAAKQALEVEVVEPEFVNQEDQTSQVFPPEAAINTQTTSETQEKNPESSVDKPKKKRKYYPKNKK